jgi:cytoskeleton protein RodZ
VSDEREDLPQVGAEAAEMPPQEIPLPGRFLREAREERHLAVFEVAQSLKFSTRQIEALEADDYGALPPGATFLRGFVRSYAKLLKVDSEPLLAMLDARAPAVLPDVRAPQNMGIAATPAVAGRRSSTPLFVGALLFATVAVGLGVWHFFGSSQPSATAAKPVPAATEPEAAPVRPPEIRIEETPAAGQAPAALPAAPNAAGTRQLVFVFADKSWVEVKDASQRVILAGEFPGGAHQAVVGKPPFQLVIGNAAQVELQYEDRQIDLKPHTRAEVARLTLE